MLVDTSLLSGPAQKVLDPKSPLPMRQMAARAIAPGLRPADLIAVVVALSQGQDEALATLARTTLEKLPAPVLQGALSAELQPAVIDALVDHYSADPVVMQRLLAMPNIELSTVEKAAEHGTEAVSELIATNEERLLSHPSIIERLYMNKRTRMSTADRVLELAVRNGLELSGIPAFREAAQAIANELVLEASEGRTPDDDLFDETDALAQAIPIDLEHEDTHHFDEETGEEAVQEKCLPLHAQLAKLTISQKIRRAMLGTGAERMLLVRDSNKLVAVAAVRSPQTRDNDILRMSSSRSVSEDVIRVIALDKKWSGLHQVKFNLVCNPRCPFIFASKFLPHLREHELKVLAKSKNVPGAVATAAKQILGRKTK